MLLGVIVRDLTDPFFGVVVGALSGAAKKHGYSLVLGDAKGGPPRRWRLPRFSRRAIATR
jgi:DNA-binding LacI/PurR family transcriptional regulator